MKKKIDFLTGESDEQEKQMRFYHKKIGKRHCELDPKISNESILWYWCSLLFKKLDKLRADGLTADPQVLLSASEMAVDESWERNKY